MDKYTIFLKLDYRIKKHLGVELNKFDGDYIYQLYFDEENSVTINLGDDVSAQIFYEKIDRTRILNLRVKGSYEVSEKRYNAFKEVLQEDRNIHLLNLEIETGTINNFLKDKISILENKGIKIFKLLRWRYNLDSDNNWVKRGEYHWSFDNTQWHKLSNQFNHIYLVHQEIIIKEDIEAILNLEEPVYHDLIREAFELRIFNHRSSLIIGLTALETAVKKAIVNKVDKFEWLVENSPIPPIDKVLKDFLPQIFDGFNISAEDIKEIKNAIFERNKLVHLGEEPKEESLLKRLNIIKDILYLIDYNLGNKWCETFFDN